MNNECIFRGYGVEVDIEEKNFLKIKETLTRIGILSKKDNTLYQSCHILHKQGRYVIIHFKELFVLDNKVNSIDEHDIARRNTIIKLLQEWELLSVKSPNFVDSMFVPISEIKILAFKEKDNYNLVSKYNIGKVKLQK